MFIQGEGFSIKDINVKDIIRGIYEETGLNVKVKKLIYVCEKPDAVPRRMFLCW